MTDWFAYLGFGLWALFWLVGLILFVAALMAPGDKHTDT